MFRLILITVSLAFGFSLAQTSGIWESSTALPVIQSEFYGDAIGDSIYVLGGEAMRVEEQGQDMSTASNELWIYNTQTEEWDMGARMPAGRNHVAVTHLDGKLYVFGGYPQACCNSYPWPFGETNNWRYTPETNSWEELAPIPRRMGAGMAEAFEGKIYVFAGTDSGGFHSLNAAHVYDPENDSWEELSPLKNAREHTRGCVMDSLILVFGGHSNPQGTRINQGSVEAYSPASDTWYDLGDMPQARGGIGVGCIAGKAYLFGGELVNFQVLDNNDVFDPVSEDWSSDTKVPLSGIHGMATVTHKGKIHLIGGSEGGGFSPGDHHYVFTPPQVEGCTDPESPNFNRYATTDDGTCEPVSLKAGFIEQSFKWSFENHTLKLNGLPGDLQSLELQNVKGKILSEVKPEHNAASFSNSYLKPGIYIVRFKSSTAAYSAKLALF